MKDYITNEDGSLLSFRKNDVIKLVNKSYTPQGWLRGVLNGRKGLFPIEYVKPVGRLELTDISKVVDWPTNLGKNTSSSSSKESN